jgi:hypothetical protein
MNEFEWLRQTRALNEPVAPSRDLWPAIAARLGDEPATPTATATRHRHPLMPWAMAASLAALSVLAGSLSLRQSATPTPYATVASAPVAPRWKPSDPRLSGAALELDAAHSELTQAMQQAPNAAFLRRLLDRTTQQRNRLERFAHEAG